MTPSDKFLLTALEAARPDQLAALLALSEAKGVPLNELIDEAVNSWLAKEFEELGRNEQGQ